MVGKRGIQRGTEEGRGRGEGEEGEGLKVVEAGRRKLYHIKSK